MKGGADPQGPPLPPFQPERRDPAAGLNLVQAADHNLRVTLEALRRGGAQTRLDLAGVTGLTVPGIANILRRLTEDGLVEPDGGGRSQLFAIRPGGAVALGLDRTEDGFHLVAIDLFGTILFEERAARMPENDAALVRAAADRLQRERPEARLVGIGLAADPPAEGLRHALAPLPVTIERDTVAAAIAERQFGTAGADDSFVHILLGPSVRAGMVIGGSVFDGASHRAGQVGRMRTGTQGRFLDDVASTRLLPGFDPEAPDVRRWIEAAAEHLTDMIIALSAFLGPRLVTIGGRLPEPLLAALTARLAAGWAARMVGPTQPYWLPELRRASQGEAGVALGLAALPFLETLLPDPRRSFRGGIMPATGPAAASASAAPDRPLPA
ncbi:hypothetical protein GCM10011390_48060 [Aureimonas endophytica]|uniref:NBD/HSP70 family sugar kinase n=1 Tax=Aureimonas endophytica TaxID=2027858 RepID=A0A917A1Z0_9HYPH|nr:ROK family transcriptional regulator [Aureimonas endophytica]GGE23014.1 hypothetical protein GCM10011390_48060 [Aureimonas endophytica]